MTVKPVLDGYHSVTPYLVAPDVAGLNDFLQQVFDARETERSKLPRAASCMLKMIRLA